jgi:dsDNA-specific endonuclease/ATPase MutS2
MHQSGLLLPCQSETSLTVFTQVLSCPQQSYRAYLKGLQGLLRRVDGRSLVLLDDLAGGSNPGEAYALARATLEHLAEVGAKVLGCTHHAALRHSVRQHPRMQHLGLQVHQRKGHLTYALSADNEGLSQSLEFAQTVGIPPRLLQQAREHYRALSGGTPKAPHKPAKAPVAPRPPSPLKDPTLFHPKPSGLKVGATVYIQPFQQYGEVLALPNRQDQVEVLWGDKKVLVAVRDLLLSSKGKQKKGDASGIRIQTWSVATDRCDLHNLRVHEALPVLEKFLDTAYYEGLSPLYIIHGKGEGALKQAVRQHLKAAPQVLGFRDGQVGEGDGGVTVVDLRLG